MAALFLLIGLAVAVSDDARTDGAPRSAPSHDSAAAENPLPASEGLGGLRLPADPDDPGPRAGETAYF